jgi:hypothetical protein
VTGRRALVAAFVLATLLSLAFAGHALWVVTYLSESRRPVEAWRTPGYVARASDVPSEALAEALGVAQGSAKGKTLEEIAKVRGVPVASLVAAVQALVPPQ